MKVRDRDGKTVFDYARENSGANRDSLIQAFEDAQERISKITSVAAGSSPSHARTVNFSGSNLLQH